jgi:RNase adaptor protein for sRNA GlmZ degradation
MDGRDTAVMNFVEQDKRIPVLVNEMLSLAHAHVTAAQEHHITIGLEDRHGRWIAPAVGELVAEALDAAGFKVSITHRAFA